MATRLLEKGQIVKVGSVPHKLLGDVEAETATTEAVVSELAKKASKARWEKRSKEERSAHARVMLKARWSKSTVGPLKSQETASRTLHAREPGLPPIKIALKAPPVDIPPKSVAADRPKTGNMWEGVDIATPIDLMVQITGKTQNEVIIALREFKASQSKS